jgi:ribonucleoside-diphosphate reductase alpha chain
MGVASGPVSFMQLWDTLATTLTSTTPRRGAMMATLRCDHPDIEEFVEAKRAGGRLTNFNLSVQVPDAFMNAVRAGRSWPLVFPRPEGDPPHRGRAPGERPPGERGGERTVPRIWTGVRHPVSCRVVRSVAARDLWRRLTSAAYASGEPGVLYVDRINRHNNLWYRETITATNPCGEVPLPPYGACNLGSLNLVRFVRDPFTTRARLDREALARAAATAVRFLDDVIDVSPYPLPAQEEEAKGTRRVGLGVPEIRDTFRGRLQRGAGFAQPPVGRGLVPRRVSSTARPRGPTPSAAGDKPPPYTAVGRLPRPSPRPRTKPPRQPGEARA